jgi:predicted HicB family RNase H-like nuclease
VPKKPPAPTVRLVLRLPTAVHAAVRDEAAALGVSMNQFMVAKLAAPTPTPAAVSAAFRTSHPR